MRYLIFSDIHANLEALNSVLSAVSSNHIDKYIFLGDIVGYGANPNELVDVFKTLHPRIAIRGNHDKVVSGLDSGEDFTLHARTAALWSQRQITSVNKRYLQQLSKGPIVVDECFEIVHGSPHKEDFYIWYEWDARMVLNDSDRWITFFGHTHVPMLYSQNNESGFKAEYPDTQNYSSQLSREEKYLINPGSVGQPRDDNPQSSFAIFDSETDIIEINRIEYDIQSAQEKIRQMGLPEMLASRLSVGM